ncbi:MAG: hypothetical protein JKY67_21970 [Pseudomonadales bacterium]|nr:hypothetical protein [Pseudomonadales bacterium]
MPSPGLLRETAARLLAALSIASTNEIRLAIIKRFVNQLGEAGFPSFLKILLIISESTEYSGKKWVADSIALSLIRMDLPSGQLTAWGAGPSSLKSTPFSGGALYGPRTHFGPIEYLTVWFCQKTQRPYLTEEVFKQSLAKLIELLNLNSTMQQLYPTKIRTDLESAPEGAYTHQTRQRLNSLAEAWQANKPISQIAEAAVAD